MSNEHEITPDTSETWHNERQARVQAERQRVEAQEALISNAYAGCESEWAELDKQAKDAYASLDMEALDRIRDKREEVKERVKLLQNGNDALQQEKQQTALRREIAL